MAYPWNQLKFILRSSNHYAGITQTWQVESLCDFTSKKGVVKE
jgi:hypothetical protein